MIYSKGLPPRCTTKRLLTSDEEKEDESLTPSGDVEETPQGSHRERRSTPTPLAQRPQETTAPGNCEDRVPETHETPDPARRLSPSSKPREMPQTPSPAEGKKRVQASPLTAKTGGFVHIPPRTNINETPDWRAYRVILLDTIDDTKWWGKLVEFSPSTASILFEQPYWYRDEESSNQALAYRIMGKRPRH